ncbi:unnamed protein product, partial [marine sediment metagenome]
TLLDTGVLHVVGTDGEDVISIRQDVGQISVANVPIVYGNATVGNVPASRVMQIEVQGLGGNDDIRLDQGSEPIFTPASIDGGPREEFIVGGAGNDEIHGDVPTAAQSRFTSSYPTFSAENGVRYTPLTRFSIGTEIDVEADGQPDAVASLNDTFNSPNDEDGATFNGTAGLALTGLFANDEVEDHAVGIVTSGVWTAQGPGPSQDGQVENITPNDEVVGAIHTVVAHPTNPDILYTGAVNGGIWKTTNATAGSPNWTPLTDDQPGLSTGALEFDPTDGTNQTLVAGIGRFSSFSSYGGARSGLLRTTDGGSNWTLLDGGGTLTDKNISGVAARGSTIVVSVNYSIPFTYGNIGIYRSTDGGASFVQVSGGSGLPQGRVYDLAGHANTPTVLYAVVRDADSSNGIYKSTDTGATWV